MQVESFLALRDAPRLPPPRLPDADLVIYFGSRDVLADGSRHAALRAAYPRAELVGCSTGGHALDTEVWDEGLAVAALRFRDTTLRVAVEEDVTQAGSAECGRRLGRQLAGPGLAGTIVVSDGLNVNGSALARGLAETLGERVPVAGGLAGDGSAFSATLVGAGGKPPAERRVAAIGFYGASIRFGHGSAGGWDAFGPERRITRAEGNLLLELDGAPALDLYERYLGEEAAGLPGTALLYPLRVWDPRRPEHDVVRTVLAVDRQARSMTFAGDIPQGWMAQLMHGAMERLGRGAAEAGRRAAHLCPGGAEDSFALLVSCIGRRLVLGQRAGEEIEATLGQFAAGTPMLAFYSYGELAPRAGHGTCDLHNQTMTVTLLREAA
jgi:hypothetical protein